MSDKLLPCPWHPSVPVWSISDRPRNVHCVRCGLGCHGPIAQTRQKAIEHWNTRATPPGYVTEEECKRRCVEAAYQALVQSGISSDAYDLRWLEGWYAKKYGGKDD